MPIDPQAKALLDRLSAQHVPPFHTLPVEGTRKVFNQMTLASAMKAEPVAKAEDRLIPGKSGKIPVRVYTPEGKDPFPLLVYFHGGGYIAGSIDTHDELCRALTKGVGCIVVSVGYRLAPENKFPAAVDDGYAAISWVAENAKDIGGNPNYIAVGGDSAGGNLSAVVTLMARDIGSPKLVFQLLINPVTNFAHDSLSIQEFANGYFITKNDCLYFREHYLNNDNDRSNPYASPLKAKSLSGLPPAMVITAEFDPLRDEGEAYAARLRAADVNVISTRYEGMIHEFMSMPFTKSQKARQEAIAALRSAFKK